MEGKTGKEVRSPGTEAKGALTVTAEGLPQRRGIRLNLCNFLRAELGPLGKSLKETYFSLQPQLRPSMS